MTTWTSVHATPVPSQRQLPVASAQLPVVSVPLRAGSWKLEAGSCLSHLPQHLRRDEPAQLAGAFGREDFEINPADRPFLERERCARTDEPRGELPDVGFVADQGDARFAHVLAELLEDTGGRSRRRQRVTVGNRWLRLEVFGEHVRGLARAHQRTGNDVIETDVEAVERLRLLAELRDAVARQRTLGVVWIFFAAVGSDAVPNEIQLEGGHGLASGSGG